MRKLSIGAARVRGSWSPAFKPKRTTTKKKPRTSGWKPVSYFPSVKAGNEMMPLKRYSMRNMAFLLDAWPDVVAWESGHLEALQNDDGEDTGESADFLVRGKSRSYALSILDRGRSARTEAADARLAELYGKLEIGYMSLTRKEVDEHPDLPAAKDLFYYRYWDRDDQLPFTVVTLFEENRSATLGSLHAGLGGGERKWAEILSLVANGHVEIDIGQGLNPATRVLDCRTRGWAP
jgi:hypothetical protein